MPASELDDALLRIYAPGSLHPLHEAIIEGFSETAPDVAAMFAPPAYSGVLAQQIRDGAPADIFISANTRYLDELNAAGLAPKPRPLARNCLLLVSRSGLEPALEDLADFARSGLRVVIPPSIDPLGEYAAAMLERAGLTETIESKRERGEVREELASLRSWLDSGEVDASVLYTSMARSLSGVRITDLPPELDMHDQIVFAIGMIERDGRSHPAAAQFVDWMLGTEGQDRLVQGGFLPLS